MPSSSDPKSTRAVPGSLAVPLALTLVLGLGAIDYATGPEISFAIFYILPIALGTWTSGKRVGFALAGLSTVVWLSAEVFGGQQYSAQWIFAWNASTRAGVFCLVVFMLTGLKGALQTERALARIDALTGLANARAFRDAAEREIARAQRTGSPLSVAYIDVDDFKGVNDGFGHSAGDQLLRHIGECLTSNIRGTDIAARLGGDEFAILIPGADATAAQSVAQKLYDTLTEIPRDTPYEIGFSVGIASFAQVPETTDALIRAADALMYSVKAGGKRGVCVQKC